MPKGLLLAWGTGIVLYTLVAFALFHAVPWWAVNPLAQSSHSEVVTTPGLIGIIEPNIIAVVLISSVIQVPDEPLFLQPSTQAGIALLIAVAIYVTAALSARRRGVNLSARLREQLTEE